MSELVNFRDLGGFIGLDGKTVKTKTLLRSASLTEPVPRGYELGQIIDLRTAKEAAKEPDIVPPGAKYIRLNILMDGSVKGAGIGSLVAWGRVKGCHNYLLGVYTGFVTSKSARAGFAGFINACADAPKGATLFHCVAGKDRTGFAAAILLKTLGVSYEDIMADYLRTQTDRAQANEAFIAHHKRKGLFFKKQQEALRVIMGVMPEYLNAAFKAMDDNFGGFDGYLAHGLGITRQAVDRLRERYLPVCPA